jgi:hypothetical protein
MQSPSITLQPTATPSSRAKPAYFARLRKILVKAFTNRIEAQCRAIARQQVYIGL